MFAILAFVASYAGFLGIPLGLILISWFFKYAYILFDHTVRGFDEPPTLDIQMVNPMDEQRPLAQVAILGLGFGGLKLIEVYGSRSLAVALAVVFLLVVPASVAVLGLEGNPLKAIYPLALWRMIAGLGWMYGVVLAIITGYGLLLGGVAHLQLPSLLEIALTLFAVLSSFSALAGILYDRRHELGLETWHSPERTAEQQRKATLRSSEKEVTDAYGQVRVGEHVKAWQMLQAWLESRGRSVADYHWLCQRVESWNDARYSNRLTAEYVDKLLALKRNGEALEVVVHRLRIDPKFRPKSAESTLQVARLAALGGGSRPVARTLLEGYEERFPGDARVLAAAALARHLGD